MKQWLLFCISIGFLIIAVSPYGSFNQKWSMIFFGLLIIIASGIILFKGSKKEKNKNTNIH